MIRNAFPISPTPSSTGIRFGAASAHDRVYGVLLFLLAGAAAWTIGMLARLMQSPQNLPPWFHCCMIGLCGGYLIAIVTTLYLRRFRPLAGARAAAMLNGALLVVVPAGTIVGAYGLWKCRGDDIVPRRGAETGDELPPMLLHDRAVARHVRRARELDHITITASRAN